MSYQSKKISLGTLLCNAGLISQEKLQIALRTQKKYSNMKLGEVLVLQEGIQVQTINFFVNQWQDMVRQGKQFPLSYYLKKACLLNEQQIATILREQQYSRQEFGTIAVEKGWINQKTVDFFETSLPLKPPEIMSLASLEEYNSNVLHLEQKYPNYSLVLGKILAWTGGNYYLTIAICKALSNSNINITAGSEINAVNLFIENSIIKKWQVSEVAEYIKAVKQRLVNNPRCAPKLLLKEYREILLFGSKKYRNTKEQNELLLLGLLLRENESVSVSNIIYQQIFNLRFIARELEIIRPDASKSKNVQAKKRNASDIEVPDRTFKKTVLNKNTPSVKADRQAKKIENDDGKLNLDISRPVTVIVSLISLGAIALSTPLFLKMNNYYSSKLQEEETSKLNFVQKGENTQQLCDAIDFADSSASLNLLSRLEEKQQLSEQIPINCEIALDRLRIMAVPELGKENRILEAINHLCKIPKNSEMHLEAKVWLKHWYDSAAWGKKTQFYLEDFTKYKNLDCPAAHFMQSEI